MSGYNLPTYERDGYLYNDGYAVYYCDGAVHNNGYSYGTSGCGVYGGSRMERSLRNPAARRNPFYNTTHFATLHAIERALEIASERRLDTVEIRANSMWCLNAISNWVRHFQRRVNGLQFGRAWRSDERYIIEHQNVIEHILFLETKFSHVEYAFVYDDDSGIQTANDLAYDACYR